MTRHAIKTCALFLVAANAPTHLERGDLLDDLHRLNRAVTLLTLQLGLTIGVDMDAMAKMRVLRKVMDLNPFDGGVILVMLGDFLNRWSVGPNDIMTAHARIEWRDPTTVGTPGRCVTVLAGDFSIPSVQLVAKRDRLSRLVADIIDRITWCPHPPGLRFK